MRQNKQGKSVGAGMWMVTYPKYKKGGAVAKEVKETCTYGNHYKSRLL